MLSKLSILFARITNIFNFIVVLQIILFAIAMSGAVASESEANCSYNGNGQTTEAADSTKPKLIVFDLDYTLWPFWVECVDPPFSMKGSKVVDSRGKTINYFPEVPQVLEYIKSEGISMAIASRTSEIEGANQLLKLFGWNKYFDHKEIYPGCKVTHFSRFKKATGLPYQSMMFFDDEERNIRDLTKEGVHCVFVKKGVTMKLLKDSLQEFADKSKCQKNFSDYFKRN